MLGELERRGLEKPAGWENWFTGMEDPKVLFGMVSQSRNIDALAARFGRAGLPEDAATREATLAFRKCGSQLLSNASFQLALGLFATLIALIAVLLGQTLLEDLAWVPIILVPIWLHSLSNYRQGRIYLLQAAVNGKLDGTMNPALRSWIWEGLIRHLKGSLHARVIGSFWVLGVILAVAWPRIEEALDPNILRGTVRDTSVMEGHLHLHLSKNHPRNSVAIPLSEFSHEISSVGAASDSAALVTMLLHLGSRYKGERIRAQGKPMKREDGSTCVFVAQLVDIRFVE